LLGSEEIAMVFEHLLVLLRPDAGISQEQGFRPPRRIQEDWSLQAEWRLLSSGATVVESVPGVRPLKIGVPRWVCTLAVSMESFAVNGTPVQWSQLVSSLYRRLCFTGELQPIIGHRNDRIHLGVDGLDAIEVRLHDFHRRDLAGATDVRL
jgi:hypothetical protein